jgi:hypothetical protein
MRAGPDLRARWPPRPDLPGAAADRLGGVSVPFQLLMTRSAVSPARSPFRRAVTLRWDGTAWTPAPSLQKGGTPITLTGVAAVSATEAWAVGIFGGSPEQTLAFHLK